MTVTAAYGLVLAAVLLGTGVLAAAWRRDHSGGLVALPLLTAAGAVAMAAAGHAGDGHGPRSGEELAALVAMVGLALTFLATALGRRRTAR